MAIFAVPILYIAWFLTWGGTFMTTCTMGDPKSLAGAILYSCVPYAAAFSFLISQHLRLSGLVLSLPLVPLMLWQAVWGAELFILFNIGGQNACNLITGEEFGAAEGDWFELLYAPYYFLTSVSSIAGLAYSHWRHRQGLKRRTEDSQSSSA